ncbi:MAG: putative addiction module antidote protein [Candidatus Promineofilum sp.]|nr:putative addiction module antidote protein [Promineifilum sp.]
MDNFAKFDAADYLDSEEVIVEYLTAALEDENPDVFLSALADVAKARGMSVVAQNSGLGRESLYKALTPGAKPRYDTILKVLHGLGVKLIATSVPVAAHTE